MDAAERKIDVRQALRAYQTIVDRGERAGDVYQLAGLSAQTDFDGYTVSLSDGVVTVRVLFHSRVAIETPSAKALETFVGRLARLVDS